MTFNPQVGRSTYEQSARLQQDVARLGGVQSSLGPMEQSLLENEARYIGKNSLDPNNNNSLRPQGFNPYARQGGIDQAEAVTGRPKLIEDSLRPSYKQDVSPLEMARMMRIEREHQMAERDKFNQKFSSFNKMLKSSVQGQEGFN